MSNLQFQLRPLLAQFTNATGRGNLIAANDALIHIIQSMATAIDQPCACCAKPVQVNEAQLPSPVEATQPIAPRSDKDPRQVGPRPRGRPRKLVTKKG